MKFNTPFRISIYISTVILILLLVLYYFFNVDLPIYFFIITYLVIGAFSYFIIKNYVQRKINLLYRIIHKQKSIDESDLDIEQSEKEVLKWLSERQAEIEHLKDTEKFRRNFLGNVSHELKTPIFNIQGYIMTLLEGGLEDESINRKYLERTQNSVERMISIVEDLSNISNIEGSNEKINIKKFDISTLVFSLMESLENKARTMLLGIQKLMFSAGIPFSTNQIGGMFGFFFLESLPQNIQDVSKSNDKMFCSFLNAAISNGIYFAPSKFEAGFISYKHSDKEIDKTLEIVEKIIKNGDIKK